MWIKIFFLVQLVRENEANIYAMKTTCLSYLQKENRPTALKCESNYVLTSVKSFNSVIFQSKLFRVDWILVP